MGCGGSKNNTVVSTTTGQQKPAADSDKSKGAGRTSEIEEINKPHNISSNIPAKNNAQTDYQDRNKDKAEEKDKKSEQKETIAEIHQPPKHSSNTPAKTIAGNDSNDEKRDQSKEKETTFTKFQLECLTRHNEHRAIHGVPPMSLSKRLNDMAQLYAFNLAARKTMQHSQEEDRRVEPGQLGCAGENLANSGTTGPAKQEQGSYFVDMWYSEIKDYNFNKPGFVKGTGHFTQEIWADSTELGVGVASYEHNGYNMEIVVANYYPPGNVQGQFEQKVPRKVKGSPSSHQLNIIPPKKVEADNVKTEDKKNDPPQEKGNFTQFQSECLSSHNKHRAMHGAPPIFLSNRLNNMAQKYANNLANRKTMEHSEKETRRVEQGQLGCAGENLAFSGTTGPPAQQPGSHFVNMWYDEIKDYNFNKPGFAMATGHFTQEIWIESTELGIGIATYKKNGFNYEIVVANYFPPGNVQGQFDKMVLRKKKRT